MFKRSLFILLLFTLVACKPPEDNSQANITNQNSAIKAQIEIPENPKLGIQTLSVYALENNQGLSGASVEITGDMTHAGMVPVIATAFEIEAGLYQTKDFDFTMAGDWILTTVIKTSSGEKFILEKKLTVAGD